MFRFTIRELLILTVTAGLAVGWCLDHRRIERLTVERDDARRFAKLRLEFVESSPVSSADENGPRPIGQR